MKRQPSRGVVRVRVSTDQAPLFHVPGQRGGWFISLLFGHGASVDIPMKELGELLAGSRGEVIVARRLTRAEAGVVERRRTDCDADVHAWLLTNEELRFRRLRRGGKSAKLAARAAIYAGDELARRREGA